MGFIKQHIGRKKYPILALVVVVIIAIAITIVSVSKRKHLYDGKDDELLQTLFYPLDDHALPTKSLSNNSNIHKYNKHLHCFFVTPAFFVYIRNRRHDVVEQRRNKSQMSQHGPSDRILMSIHASMSMEQALLLHWALNVPVAPNVERHNKEHSGDITMTTALAHTPCLQIFSAMLIPRNQQEYSFIIHYLDRVALNGVKERRVKRCVPKFSFRGWAVGKLNSLLQLHWTLSLTPQWYKYYL